MNFLILLVLVSLVFIIGYGLGTLFECRKIESETVGTINIDRSIPGEENLFFEVGIPIHELSQKNTVLVKVTNHNYIQEETNNG